FDKLSIRASTGCLEERSLSLSKGPRTETRRFDKERRMRSCGEQGTPSLPTKKERRMVIRRYTESAVAALT
ncbi:MAG: hypothetical protein LBS86_02275, partial [Treponema sp.]|nr:hypothetical protein [Treponema sp.]